MNKKIIKLTESDLHKIVKESVNKILSEAINELDPRTYASYAQKRQQQADNATNMSDKWKYGDKAWQGQVAARDAYNKQFGTNSQNFGRGYNEFHNMNHGMYGNDYTVTDSEQTGYNRNGEGRTRGYQQEYNPQNDTYNYRDWDKSVGDTSDPQKRSHVYQIDPRHKIAQQMAKGNGNYVKGQGWQ